jgi:GTP-binding protein Era
MIREQIFHLFEDEIPFSTFVEVTSCKGVDELAEIARIEASIYVAKQSQVPILLGKGGKMIKELGIRSRKEIEKFLGQKVFLGLSIKLRKEWRNDGEFIEKSGMLR